LISERKETDPIGSKWRRAVLSADVGLLVLVIEWLIANRVCRRFHATSFFLVAASAYSQSFCGFFGVATVNIFSSVNKMMLTTLDEYFQKLFRMAEFCMAVGFTQLRKMSIFEQKYFTR